MELKYTVLCCISLVTTTVSIDPCTNHNELTGEVKRAAYYKLNFGDDTPINDLFLTHGWYRIISEVGDEMPTIPPDPLQCGTWYPIWLNDTLPSVADGKVSKEVCLRSFNKQCLRSWNIEIQNCIDGFYVYNLLSSPVEKSAYCFGAEQIPCPEGHASETGFYPNCQALYPDAKVTPSVEPDLVLGPEVLRQFGESLVTVFRCKFDEAIAMNAGETYIYDVLWYINNNFVTAYKNVSYSDIESTNLVEDDWVGQHKLNMVVNCTVRLRFSKGSTPGPEQSSPVYSAGIYPDRYEYQVKEDETITITLHSTFPVGCFGHTDNLRKICDYKLRLVQPRYQKEVDRCNNNINDNDLVFEGQKKCYYKVVSATWNDTISINITGYINGQYDHTDRITHLRVKGQDPVDTSPWNNITIPDIKIIVVDQEKHQTAGRICKSVNDPHMTTIDGRYYEFHNPGEFIMYRHKTLPYQVNALYGKCNLNRATCNCGIAIRSGKSLFVMRSCDEITSYNTHTHNPLIEMRSCDDSAMTIQEVGKTYTVTLPIGTEIKFSFSVGWGIWNNFIGYIHIKPSVIDVGNVEGLCGHATDGLADQYDDFQLRDGTLVNDAYIFGEDWRVRNDEEFFVNFPVILSENVTLKQYCICDNDHSGSSDSGFNFLCGLSGPLQTCLAKKAHSSNFHTTCSTGSRKKRSLHHIETRSLSDSDDVIDSNELVIANDEDLKSTNNFETKTDWPTGWSEELARNECESNLKLAITEEIIEASNLDIERYISMCMLDIQEVGDLRYLQDTTASMQATAMSELSRNESLFLNADGYNDETAGDRYLNSLCPNNCSLHGLCQKGNCECFSGYGGQDCSNDLKDPPQNISVPLGGICNTRTRPCEKTNIQGIFYSREIICNSRHFQITNDGSWSYTSAAKQYSVEYKNTYLLTFELPTLHRRKRSTADTVIADGYEISLSQDGSNFGDSVKIMIYDEDCFSCDVLKVTCVSLDTCPVETTAVPQEDTSEFINTRPKTTTLSDITTAGHSTSSKSSLTTTTTLSSTKTSTAASTTNENKNTSSTNTSTIIGIVVGVILVLILAVAGVVFYKMKSANIQRKADNMINNATYGNVSPMFTNGPSKFDNRFIREKTNASLGNLSFDFEDDSCSRPRTPVELFYRGNDKN